MNQYKNLTSTQKNIVDLFLNGYLTSKEIAIKLDISTSSVDNHFFKVRKSLGVYTNSQLFRLLTNSRKHSLLEAINQIKIII